MRSKISSLLLRRYLAVAVAVIWIFGSATSFAMISNQNSNAQVSPDGKWLLVMVSPYEKEKEYFTKFTLPDGKVVAINETFPKSGVYDAATFQPVWQVDWFCHAYELQGSPDFTDVVRLNRFGLESMWALAFYHNGRLTRRYACSELLTALKNPELFPFTSHDWHNDWHDAFEIKDGRLFVSTGRRHLAFIDLGFQEFYVFDLSTGAIVQKWTGGWVMGLPAVAIPVLLFGLWRWRVTRRGMGSSQNCRVLPSNTRAENGRYHLFCWGL